MRSAFCLPDFARSRRIKSIKLYSEILRQRGADVLRDAPCRSVVPLHGLDDDDDADDDEVG